MGAQRNHSAFLICGASVTTCNKRRLLPPWLHQERIVVVIALMTLSDIVYRSYRRGENLVRCDHRNENVAVFIAQVQKALSIKPADFGSPLPVR